MTPLALATLALGDLAASSSTGLVERNEIGRCPPLRSGAPRLALAGLALAALATTGFSSSHDEVPFLLRPNPRIRVLETLLLNLG